tara:strand:+ start:1777 stop:2475 length:699 start_codon:yes stop_codon:yes gene_type:complete
MKKLLLLSIITTTMLFSCNNNTTEQVEDLKSDQAVKIHEGSFAFCGASGAIPTGKKIIVQGVEFDEGCAICPVLDGPSISNLAMEGISETYGKFNVSENFQTPDGTDKTIWSLFWYYDSTKVIPQFNPSSNEWELLPPVNRSFIVNLDSASTSESNMFAMPGVIFDTTSTGIILAKVYGPLNEAAVPLRKAIPVKSGMTSITAAKEGFPYPVGTPVPVSNLSKQLQEKKKDK